MFIIVVNVLSLLQVVATTGGLHACILGISKNARVTHSFVFFYKLVIIFVTNFRGKNLIKNINSLLCSPVITTEDLFFCNAL